MTANLRQNIGADLPAPPLDPALTFEGFLGLEWLELTDELASARLAVRDNLKQPWGLIHGGVYSAVAESVASIATVNAVWRDGLTGSGLSNCASFLRPVTAGTVHVTARRRGHDEREWLWAIEFHDDAGRLCSLVDVTIAVRPVRPAA
jgi:1,4-dihydroxy-2-naphthoyl-CoA hydrolase